MKRNQIQIRDPFILLAEDRYYLYGTTDTNPWNGKGQGFNAYVSNDLEDWEGPFQVFQPSGDFWADENFWAPEVFVYHEHYYMIASFMAEGKKRACHILISDDPLGPFYPMNKPITPLDWWCLDGTFYLDAYDQPWLIFCREWMEVNDGRIYAVKLSCDLERMEGEPVLLFSASEAPWVKDIGIDQKNGARNYVTDGPFLFLMGDGHLSMIWSSFEENGYTIGQLIAEEGILSKWNHKQQPLYEQNGGHGMIFRTLENKLKLALHYPNENTFERLIFLDLVEKNGCLAKGE